MEPMLSVCHFVGLKHNIEPFKPSFDTNLYAQDDLKRNIYHYIAMYGDRECFKVIQSAEFNQTYERLSESVSTYGLSIC